MPPRKPTPRQREVLEAMLDGTEYELSTQFHHSTVAALRRHRWIKRVSEGLYVITEAGRRAVARKDGGV